MALTLAIPQRRTRSLAQLFRAIVFSGLVILASASGLMLYVADSAASSWTHPHRNVPAMTPAEVGLDYEDVALFTEDGLHLAAWYVPSHNRAAVIIVHGLGGNRAGDLDLARALADRGYGLMLLDLRAHGDSEGEVSTLSPHEVRDVRAAVQYLQQRPDVDPERIGIHGSSLGAAVAIMSAAEIDDLHAVVADSGFASIDWVVQNQFEKLERVPKWMAPIVVALGSRQAGVDAAEMAPIRQVARISPRPLLIVHGDRDETFLLKNATMLAAAAGDSAQLWIRPGVGHVRSSAPNPAEYPQRIGDFFDQTLGADTLKPDWN
jgi:uncharacterized protein